MLTKRWGSEKYTTHGKKNTAAGGYGRGLKVECVLVLYPL
jgi:hypothetical protein